MVLQYSPASVLEVRPSTRRGRGLIVVGGREFERVVFSTPASSRDLLNSASPVSPWSMVASWKFIFLLRTIRPRLPCFISSNYNIPKTIAQHARKRKSLVINQTLRLFQKSSTIRARNDRFGDKGLNLSNDRQHDWGSIKFQMQCDLMKHVEY